MPSYPPPWLKFSGIKGGRLAAAASPATVVSLVVFDIPGDEPARRHVERRCAGRGADRYRIALPARIRLHIEMAQAAPRPDDPRFARNTARLIASAGLTLEAAAARAKKLGIEAAILSDAIDPSGGPSRCPRVARRP
jgi:glycerate 2-kinase